MPMDKKPGRWPYSDGTLSRRRLLASRSESAGRSDSNAGPMLKCDPRAVRIAFWVSCLLAAVIVCALLARVWGLA